MCYQIKRYQIISQPFLLYYYFYFGTQ